jgi:site-specific DNA-methyltransferase (adenine-specific)
MSKYEIINNDCIKAMKEMPDNSVDSIVTDPPYELGFMGKSWDASGIAFNVEVWEQALRVLKPGGHLIAFSGSRTYHRMAVAIEDAGFQIRDQIMWVYGSGFPKSHNISKGIDKAAGAERKVVGIDKVRGNAPSMMGRTDPSNPEYDGSTFGVGTTYITAPATPAAQQWNGWGTALKPAHEPMVLARKPLEGTVANNVLTHGVGGLNIDATRIASTDNFDGLVGRPIQKLATRLNDETDVEYKERVLESPEQQAALAKLKELGRFPANFIHDGNDEVVALFPDTKPSKQSLMGAGGIPNGANNLVGSDVERNQDFESVRGFDDSGSAARFFYCAKASKRDRNEGLEKFEQIRTGAMQATVDGSMLTGSGNERKTTRANHHPTVKPTTLMQYLVRLVTPLNGIVLDPFMGSGSTGKACMYENFNFIGIDMTLEYVEIAKARIEHALQNKEMSLFDDNN